MANNILSFCTCIHVHRCTLKIWLAVKSLNTIVIERVFPCTLLEATVCRLGWHLFSKQRSFFYLIHNLSQDRLILWKLYKYQNVRLTQLKAMVKEFLKSDNKYGSLNIYNKKIQIINTSLIQQLHPQAWIYIY